MKNTIEINMQIDDHEIVIEGKCPHCMTNDELVGFFKGITLIKK